jgi:hypothetical protein
LALRDHSDLALKGCFWSNSGHRAALDRDASVVNDPKRSFACTSCCSRKADF